MKVEQIGEFGLIDRLSEMAYGVKDPKSKAWQQLVLGIGDDCAAWYGDTSIQLATVDALIQDVHFNLGIISWEELGWRAMAANLSDIAAMGGMAKYALISLAMPGDTEVEDIFSLYRGMIALAQQFDTVLAGGNISSAPLLIINITIFGSNTGRNKPILTRSAARVGDKVAVTGNLGVAAAGREMLTRHLRLSIEDTAILRKAFCQPIPRITEGQILVENGVKAGMDISDGLISDLGHICQSSKVGARIEIELLPTPNAVRDNFGAKAQEFALAGGDDYELLFTAGAEIMDTVKSACPTPITVIGEITAGKKGEITLVDSRNRLINTAKRGWDHFIKRQQT